MLFWYAILCEGKLIAITQAEDPPEALIRIHKECNGDLSVYRALTLCENVDWIEERNF
ncbi:hypothetical protein SMD22_00990 (plasmid) [Brevibacillus halotolerans]|nr:hypothetical protein SMD22_00990 [Brevibacillus halotolerans]